jgi:hypothetical protein
MARPEQNPGLGQPDLPVLLHQLSNSLSCDQSPGYLEVSCEILRQRRGGHQRSLNVVGAILARESRRGRPLPIRAHERTVREQIQDQHVYDMIFGNRKGPPAASGLAA